MIKRVTPDKITQVHGSEVFVFGSNQAGIHGAGAAYTARLFGAQTGIGTGLEGRSYAIPTKDMNLEVLPVDIIRHYVDLFIEDAKFMRDRIFLVTEIGCGLAGYTPEEIAPLFVEAMSVKNIYLPEKFWEVLTKLTEV
jgi:hypothetical protein